MQRSSGVGEWRTPPAVSGEDARDAGTALDDVFAQAARWPDRAAVSRKAAGVWTPLTWGELAEQVVSLARGLIAAGVRPGDRVALMSATRLEWALCDFAIWAAGAVTVPIYETSSADQVGWIFADSGAVAVFAGDDRCEAVVRQAEPSAVRQVWHLDRLGEVIEPGSGVPVAEVESRRRELTAGDLATIVYTSGTTGPAKGCMITHANLVAEVRNVTRVEGVGELVLHENASVLLFLPLAHVFARAVQLAALHRGVLVGYSPDMKDVPAVIEDRLRAHWLVDQCVVVGEGRPYVGALVTVDPESFPRWKHDHGKPPEAELSELRDDPDLLRTIQEAVDVANRAVSRAEAVKRFRRLEGVFTVGRELTPTQKVRRHYVLDRYAHEVDALYGTA